jgi:hypothetical protein
MFSEGFQNVAALLLIKGGFWLLLSVTYTLQRQNAENSKHIFPEKEFRGFSPSFHIHVSVSELYLSHDGSAFSAGGNMWTDPGNL